MSLPGEVTVGDIVMIAVYFLLSILWVVVLGATLAALALRPRHLLAERRRVKELRWPFLIFAVILCIDSIFWAIVNTVRVGSHAELVNQAVENALRNSWLVAGVKGAVLLSAVVFFSIVMSTNKTFLKGIEQAYFSKFVDLTWDAIGILDAEGRVRLWNCGAEHLFGFRRDKVIGQHIRDFLVPEDLSEDTDSILTEAGTGGRAAIAITPIG